MNNKQLANVLDDICTVEQLRTFSREYKEANKDLIKLTENKSGLIENIIKGVEKSKIPKVKVLALISDSEEYGDQYIYLFKLRDKSIKANLQDGNHLFKRIIPVESRRNFPLIRRMPDNLEWADLRVPNRGVANSWLSKMYNRDERKVMLKNEFNEETETYTVEYKMVPSRLIYIIEWNGKDNLEVRISRNVNDRKNVVDNSLNLIRQSLEPSIYLDSHFVKTDLTSLASNLLAKAHENQNIYRVEKTKLQDSQDGTAEFRTFGDEDEDIFDEDTRAEAINSYIQNGGNCDSLVLRLLEEGSNEALKSDINVILCRDAVHQIIIPSKLSPSEFKYVRSKLSEFN